MEYRIKVPLTLVLLLCATTALAQTPKQPWLWSPDERIRERFSPESKAQRLRLAESQSVVRTSPPNSWPISGDTHPELFFPWELMDRLLRSQMVSPSQLESLRSLYRSQIIAAGWDYDKFWRELDLSAADYLVIWNQITEEQRQTHGNSPRGIDRERMVTALCAARFEALTKMRANFGDVEFDRFLYTALAPVFQSWITDERGPDMLIRVERGCK